MKYKLVFLIILSILYLSCEDKKNVDDSPLISTWSLLSALNEFYLTTNSNQNCIDYNSKGIGEITVSNGADYSLTYLTREIEDEWESFTVSNNSNPNCYLSISSSPSTVEAFFYIQQNDDDTYYDNGQLDFTYDGLTLTVNPSTLYTTDHTDSVQVVGSITSKTFPINANVPTVVESDELTGGNTTLKLKSDGSYIFSISFSFWSEITKGNWVVNGDILTLTTTEEDGEEVYWVEEYNYEINNDELTLSAEYFHQDICPDLSLEECNTYYENQYGLDQGSLVSIRYSGTTIFNR
jgi:hypothetical protein